MRVTKKQRVPAICSQHQNIQAAHIAAYLELPNVHAVSCSAGMVKPALLFVHGADNKGSIMLLIQSNLKGEDYD